MKNFFIGIAFGAFAMWSLPFFVAFGSNTKITATQNTAAKAVDTTKVVSTASATSHPLSEQQFRRIIQQEFKAAMTVHLATLLREPQENAIAVKHSTTTDHDTARQHYNDTIRTDNDPMYQTVNDIVESAKYDGYFTDQSLAELRMHYHQLTDAQKFQIDAKLAASVNNGSLSFDDALFIEKPR